MSYNQNIIIKLFLVLTLFTSSSISSFSQKEKPPMSIDDPLAYIKCLNWVDSVYYNMTLDEKIGQLFMMVAEPTTEANNIKRIKEMVQEQKIGGLLFSGGEAIKQAEVTNLSQSWSKTPLLISLDGEWGLAMRLSNTIRFPRNMMLGAISNSQLIYRYGEEVGRQCKEMGIQVNFAPDADVNSNSSNPVIGTRSFGENPKHVAQKAILYTAGIQSQNVMGVGKHFPGHGDTSTDSHKALPIVNHKRTRLDSMELYPFKKLIKSGIGGIMTGHLFVPALDDTPNQPSSLSYTTITELLKQEYGFQGLVFTDALEMKGVANAGNICVRALNAGNDVLLKPFALKTQIKRIKSALETGDLSRGLFEEKVMKILMYKYILGLSNYKKIELEGLKERLNNPSGINLNKELHRNAMTLLKNVQGILPLRDFKNAPLLSLAIGSKQNNDFQQRIKRYSAINSYTISSSLPTSALQRILQKSSKNGTIIITIHSYRAKENKALIKLCKKRKVVLIFFTSPYKMINFKKSIANAEAVMAAYETSKLAQECAAEAIMGGIEVTGHLPVSVNSLFKSGTGLKLKKSRISYLTPTTSINTFSLTQKIDSVIKNGLKKKAFPGCQIMILKDGNVVFDKNYGHFDYATTHPVLWNDLYDLASLTKTSAIVPMIMWLVENKKIQLTNKVSTFLPFLKNTDKETIQIKELLFHESGFPAIISFYKFLIDPESYSGPLLRNRRNATYRLHLEKNLYANKNFRFKKELVHSKPSKNYNLKMAKGIYLHTSVIDSIQQTIADAKLSRRGHYRYSDINFILLKMIIEKITKQPIEQSLSTLFYQPLGMNRTAYSPLQKKFKTTCIAPTEHDYFLRKQLLVGYVHDESAAMQGGISGNAGLFSNANDIAKYLQMLLFKGSYGGAQFLKPETIDLFTKSKSKVSRRALGFDKANKENLKKSPIGLLASKSGHVFGHYGFTGTAYWVDPELNLIYIFLSNRVYPSRDHRAISKLSIRSGIQEIIYQSIKQD